MKWWLLLCCPFLLCLNCALGRCKPGVREACASGPREPGANLLPGPSLKSWKGLHIPAASARASLSKGYPSWAMATRPEVFVYGTYGDKAWVWGRIRAGQRVPVRLKQVSGNCKSGRWYETASGGFVCSSQGLLITKKDDRTRF